MTADGWPGLETRKVLLLVLTLKVGWDNVGEVSSDGSFRKLEELFFLGFNCGEGRVEFVIASCSESRHVHPSPPGKRGGVNFA